MESDASSQWFLGPVPLQVARYRFVFGGLSAGALPAYSGSTWRGGLGRALRKAVCVTRERQCRHCLLNASCIYARLFEPLPPPGRTHMRRYDTIPAPYLLVPPERIPSERAGEVSSHTSTYMLGLTLLGRANESLPHIIHAMALMAENGLGAGRSPCRFLYVQKECFLGSGHWKTIYRHGEGGLEDVRSPPFSIPPPPDHDRLSLHFITPLRLRIEGHYRTPANLRFADLFSALLRRISALCYFYGESELCVDFKRLTRLARETEMERCDMEWWEWERYSSRQKRKIPMGGMTGCIVMDGTAAAPFWPYLWMGQWIHVGKGTSMGMGRFWMDFFSSASD